IVCSRISGHGPDVEVRWAAWTRRFRSLAENFAKAGNSLSRRASSSCSLACASSISRAYLRLSIVGSPDSPDDLGIEEPSERPLSAGRNAGCRVDAPTNQASTGGLLAKRRQMLDILHP